MELAEGLIGVASFTAVYDPKKALDLLGRAGEVVARVPDDSSESIRFELLTARSLAEHQSHNLDAAIGYWEEAIKLAPAADHELPELELHLGKLYFERSEKKRRDTSQPKRDARELWGGPRNSDDLAAIEHMHRAATGFMRLGGLSNGKGLEASYILADTLNKHGWDEDANAEFLWDAAEAPRICKDSVKTVRYTCSALINLIAERTREVNEEQALKLFDAIETVVDAAAPWGDSYLIRQDLESYLALLKKRHMTEETEKVQATIRKLDAK